MINTNIAISVTSFVRIC